MNTILLLFLRTLLPVKRPDKITKKVVIARVKIDFSKIPDTIENKVIFVMIVTNLTIYIKIYKLIDFLRNLNIYKIMMQLIVLLHI